MSLGMGQTSGKPGPICYWPGNKEKIVLEVPWATKWEKEHVLYIRGPSMGELREDIATTLDEEYINKS